MNAGFAGLLDHRVLLTSVIVFLVIRHSPAAP